MARWVDERSLIRYPFPDLDWVTVGCGDKDDIRVHGPGVARRHLVLRRVATGWLALNNSSTTGVYLQGINRLLTWDHGLQSGDRLRLGDSAGALILRYEGPNTSLQPLANPSETQPRVRPVIAREQPRSPPAMVISREGELPPGPAGGATWGLRCDLRHSNGLFIGRCDVDRLVTSHPPGSGPSLEVVRLTGSEATPQTPDWIWLFGRRCPAWLGARLPGPQGRQKLVVRVMTDVHTNHGFELRYMLAPGAPPSRRADGHLTVDGATGFDTLTRGLSLIAPGVLVPAR